MQWAWIVVVVAVVAFVVYRRLPAKGVTTIQAQELKQMIGSKSKSTEFQLVDVREPSEFRGGHVQGFQNIPLGQLKQQVEKLERDKPVVVMCHSGMRSSQAARVLVKQGFSDVRNLAGGMSAWNARRNK